MLKRKRDFFLTGRTGAARGRQGSLAEFPLAIWLILLFIAFPLINFTGLAIAATCIFLTASSTAEKASANQTYKNSLSAVKREADYINQSGFATFAGLMPVAGFEQSGVDLFIQATSVSGQSQVYGPNTPIGSSVDTTTYIYEYMTKACYDVKPVISMAAIPVLGSIPGLGKPARISMTAHRACEFPQGLNPTTGKTNFAGGTAPISLAHLGLDTPGTLSDTSGASWNHPTIYRQISNAGEKVVSENVFYVYANNPDWTSANVATQQGDHVWMDYSAEGAWTIVKSPWYEDSNFGLSNYYRNNPPTGTVDASGDYVNPAEQRSLVPERADCGDPNLGKLWDNGFTSQILPNTDMQNGDFPQIGTMLAKVDNSLYFEVGKKLTIKPPPGKLYLRINMNEYRLNAADKARLFSFNKGKMLVRIVVTRPT